MDKPAHSYQAITRPLGRAALVAFLGIGALGLPGEAVVRVNVQAVIAGVLPSVAQLLSDGPRFERHTDRRQGAGLFRGDQPLVVDFELSEAGYLELHIGLPGEPSEVFTFQAKGGRRVHEKTELDRKLFGRDLNGRLYLARAWAGKPPKKRRDVDQRRAIPFTLYGLGTGTGAVASLAIDRVGFAPDLIRLDLDEEVECSARFRNSFNRARFEIYRQEKDGSLAPVRAIDGGAPNAGDTSEERWDGLDQQGVPSLGRHSLLVRAWQTAVDDGSWVFTETSDLVTVE